jgi:hypothetical protein
MVKDILVIGHCGLGDNIMCIGIVRYLRKYNSSVYVACCKKYIKNLSYFYEDDKNIILFPIVNNWNNCNINLLKSRFKLYTLGCFYTNPQVYDYPLSFYDNANIARKEFINSFKIPSTTYASVKLFNKIKLLNKKIIFMHTETGTTFNYDIKNYEKRLNINNNDYLYINPCTNMYSKDDKYYNLCQELLHQESLLFYKDIIINSEIIIVTDSCFWCLSLFLNLKTKKCYYLSRCNNNFSYLWSSPNVAITLTSDKNKIISKKFGFIKNKFKKLN